MTHLPDDITIREATLAEIDAIHAIEVVSFPSPWRPEFFSHELDVPGRLNLVAVRSGVVVGYAFAMWILDEMHINKIAVSPDARRCGIANELMAHCLSTAREQAVEVITLEVRKSNGGAIAFYSNLGFASIFVRRRYYPDGEDAVFMTCDVPTLP